LNWPLKYQARLPPARHAAAFSGQYRLTKGDGRCVDKGRQATALKNNLQQEMTPVHPRKHQHQTNCRKTTHVS
jgi:hypothetical protein